MNLKATYKTKKLTSVISKDGTVRKITIFSIAVAVVISLATFISLSVTPNVVSGTGSGDVTTRIISQELISGDTTVDEKPRVQSDIHQQSSGISTYKVTNVVDGDTVDVNINGSNVRIRLIGVNTPEVVHPSKLQQCFGIEASNYMKNLLFGKNISIELDESQGERDIYDRLLAYVYLDGKMVNYSLIYDGYAYEYTYNMPYKYREQFIIAQKDASNNNRGLWAPTTCRGQL